MRRTLLSLALAAALMLPLVLSRPQPVSADSSCGFGADFVAWLMGTTCTLHDPAPVNCDMTQVGAKAANGGSGHSYSYILTAPCGDIHVRGAYDVNTKEAQEILSGNGRTINARWTCTSDPWIYPSDPAPNCTSIAVSVTGDTTGMDLTTAPFPLSVSPLSEYSRQVLLSQLQNAIKQLRQAGNQVLPFPTPLQPTEVVDQPSQYLAQTAGQLVPYHAPSMVAGWPQLSTFTQGEAVTSLQYLLQQSGATLSVDGKFGAETSRAVSAYQTAQGLTSDGIVGPNTWQTLIVPVQQGSQGPAVQAVQSQLKSRGVAITVDGDFGAQTDVAVRAYQAATGLPIDGQAGPPTWQALLAGR